MKKLHNFAMLLLLLAAVCLCVCGMASPPDHYRQINNTVKTTFVNIQTTYQTHKATTLLFYSPQCPICKNQTKTIADLYNTYRNDSIAFILIFPQRHYSSKAIKHFLKEYNLPIPAIRDVDGIITKHWNATVTPEAVLINKNGNPIYSGKIDNLFEDIGQRRNAASEHYLKDAIEATLTNHLPAISRTQPIGCILNLDQ